MHQCFLTAVECAGKEKPRPLWGCGEVARRQRGPATGSGLRQASFVLQRAFFVTA